MNKVYKFFVATICGCTLISTSILTAGPEQRKGIIARISGLFCNSSPEGTTQESIVNFLENLHTNSPAYFQQLFNYVANPKQVKLDPDFAKLLFEKKLINSDGSPSENLKQTFTLIKQIFDDYNSENKRSCCQNLLCCGGCLPGCFSAWCRENGADILKCTITNVSQIIIAIATNKQTTRDVGTADQVVEALLYRLSTHTID